MCGWVLGFGMAVDTTPGTKMVGEEKVIKKQALCKRLNVLCRYEKNVLAETYIGDCYANEHERQNDRRTKQELLDSTSRSERAGRLSKEGGTRAAGLNKQHGDERDCGDEQY